jgi:hypothetical protein
MFAKGTSLGFSSNALELKINHFSYQGLKELLHGKLATPKFGCWCNHSDKWPLKALGEV